MQPGYNATLSHGPVLQAPELRRAWRVGWFTHAVAPASHDAQPGGPVPWDTLQRESSGK